MLHFIDIKLSTFFGILVTFSIMNIDLSIKIFGGLLFIGYTAHRWFLLNRNKVIERQIKETELLKLKEEHRQLEIENNATERRKFLFRDEISNIPEEEFKASEERLKNNL